MMETKELRIGNWVRFTDKNEEFQIGCISHNEIEMGFVLLSEVEPIPLTEEWLLKFGFTKIDDSLWQYKNGYLIGFFANKWFIGKYNFDDMVEMIVSFDSVHQLQNLYYALTGDELQPLK